MVTHGGRGRAHTSPSFSSATGEYRKRRRAPTARHTPNAASPATTRTRAATEAKATQPVTVMAASPLPCWLTSAALRPAFLAICFLGGGETGEVFCHPLRHGPDHPPSPQTSTRAEGTPEAEGARTSATRAATASTLPLDPATMARASLGAATSTSSRQGAVRALASATAVARQRPTDPSANWLPRPFCAAAAGHTACRGGAGQGRLGWPACGMMVAGGSQSRQPQPAAPPAHAPAHLRRRPA